MKLRDKLFVRGLATEERGSWRWQDAYRIKVYAIRRTKKDKLIFFPCHSGPKRSMPQIRRSGSNYDVSYALNNIPLTQKTLQIMLDKVKDRINKDRLNRGLRLAQKVIRGLTEIPKE